MTTNSDTHSVLIVDAADVLGGPEAARSALVEIFGLPEPVAGRILDALPALVVKDAERTAAEELAERLRGRGFQARVRSSGAARPGQASTGAAQAAHRAESGDVPRVGIRRRATGAHGAVESDVRRTTASHVVVGEVDELGAEARAEARARRTRAWESVRADDGEPDVVERVPASRAEQASGSVSRIEVDAAAPASTPAARSPTGATEDSLARIPLDVLADQLAVNEPLEAPATQPAEPAVAAEPSFDLDDSPGAAAEVQRARVSGGAPAESVGTGLPAGGDALWGTETTDAPPPRSTLLDELAALGGEESGPDFGRGLSLETIESPTVPDLAPPGPPGALAGVAPASGRPSVGVDAGAPAGRLGDLERAEPSARRPGSVSGEFDRAEASFRRGGAVSGEFERAQPSVRRAGAVSGEFERAEPSVRRAGAVSGEFERAEPSVRRAGAGSGAYVPAEGARVGRDGFVHAVGGVRAPTGRHVAISLPDAEPGERPRIPFEASLVGSETGLEAELRAVSGLYDDSGAAPGPAPGRSTGSHAAVGIVGRPGGPTPLGGGSGATKRSRVASPALPWLLALVVLSAVGAVALQALRGVGQAEQFASAGTAWGVAWSVGERSPERVCARVGDSMLCRYSVDFFLATFANLDRSLAEQAAESCFGTLRRDGGIAVEEVECRVRATVGGAERRIDFEYRGYEDCEHDPAAAPLRTPFSCITTVDRRWLREGVEVAVSHDEHRATLERLAESGTANTPVGYVDAIEYGLTRPSQPAAAAQYSPAAGFFIGEVPVGRPPARRLVYLRMPGREAGSSRATTR